MIRTINIKLNAAHPELPLVEATTFTGAPSSVFIRGVPKNCGNWSITAVNVAVTYPDNSTTTRAAVESAEGVWVATIPGTATSGRTVAGFRILADGIDENGAAVTGYVLGFADFAVLSFFPVPAPGETFFYLRYFDTMPTTAKKMDVTTIDGILKYYNGTAWLPFADLTNYYTKAETDNAIERVIAYDNTVTPTSGNGVKSSGIWSAIWGALAALPTGFSSLYDWCVAQLEGKLSTSGGTVTGNISMVDGILDAGDVQTRSMFDFLLPGQAPKSLAVPENSGKALTDADIGDSSSALGAALAGKANDADVVHKTGDETIGGDKTFTGSNTVIPFITAGRGTIQIGISGRISQATAGDLLDDTYVPNYGEVKSAIPYSLVTKTISNNSVTLDDRAINAVAVSSSLASLTVNFPTATSGRVRDFGLRLTVASGITTAPQLVLPQGVTCENADGAAPEIGADGAATILYFTETASGVFLVKGEVVTAIS